MTAHRTHTLKSRLRNLLENGFGIQSVLLLIYESGIKTVVYVKNAAERIILVPVEMKGGP